MRQRQQTVFNKEVAFDHLGIDIIELVAFRQFRFYDTGHLGSIFADEISDIGNIQTLLQHIVDTFQIGCKQIHLRIPSVQPVEFAAEPGVHPWLPFFRRLRDIDMQQRIIDSFRKETVATLFHHGRITTERRPAAGERFGRNLLLSINMSAGRSGTVLDIPQIAKTPELASYLVRLSAILQELTGEPPVPVVFQPGRQAIFMAHLP